MSPNTKYSEVYRLMGRFKYRDAIAALDVIITDDLATVSPCPKAYFNRGKCYYLLGSYSAALVEFDRTIELNAKCWPAYYYRALIYGKTRKFHLSRINIDKAIELNPRKASSYYLRAITKIGQRFTGWNIAWTEIFKDFGKWAMAAIGLIKYQRSKLSR